MDYSTATQDSLPAAGQPYRAGLVTRRPNERFQVIPSSFPRLRLAHPIHSIEVGHFRVSKSRGQRPPRSVGEDGKVRWVQRVTGLDDVLRRASRLHAALVSRGVHADVLEFCKVELLQENYFHAVFEAMKSIAAKIRRTSGLTTDGAELVNQAFALGKDCTPILAINSLKTETDRSEQRGFANLTDWPVRDDQELGRAQSQGRVADG